MIKITLVRVPQPSGDDGCWFQDGTDELVGRSSLSCICSLAYGLLLRWTLISAIHAAISTAVQLTCSWQCCNFPTSSVHRRLWFRSVWLNAVLGASADPVLDPAAPAIANDQFDRVHTPLEQTGKHNAFDIKPQAFWRLQGSKHSREQSMDAKRLHEEISR